jgi:hypothetical protein
MDDATILQLANAASHGTFPGLLPTITTTATPTITATSAPVDNCMDPAEGPAAPASESTVDGPSRNCNGAIAIAKEMGVAAEYVESEWRLGAVALREKGPVKLRVADRKMNGLRTRGN